MELNNLLRPEKVKQQTKINKTRLADELFNAYQANVLHQIYDKHENQALSIPIDYEGWLNGNWVYGTELSSLMDKMKSLDSDGVEKVAKKLFNLMEKAGWSFDQRYVENGLYIALPTSKGQDNG